MFTHSICADCFNIPIYCTLCLQGINPMTLPRSQSSPLSSSSSSSSLMASFRLRNAHLKVSFIHLPLWVASDNSNNNMNNNNNTQLKEQAKQSNPLSDFYNVCFVSRIGVGLTLRIRNIISGVTST